MPVRKRLPRLRTGNPSVDAVFDEWVEEIERTGRITVAAPLNARVGEEGVQLWLTQRKRIKAKLTAGGTGGLYAWQEVYATAVHTFADLPGGLSGTTTVNPAREQNANDSVTLPAIVDLELNPDNAGFYFQLGSC